MEKCVTLLDSKAPYKGLGAESGEKREPASDIDTAVVDSLKALDPEWPIREADMAARFMSTRPGKRRQNLRWPSYGSGISGTNAVCEANCVGIATLSSFRAQRLDLRKN